MSPVEPTAAEKAAMELVKVKVTGPTGDAAAKLTDAEKAAWVLERHTPTGLQVVKPGQELQVQRHEAESLVKMKVADILK
jgi:hypothetical protein